MLKKYHFLCDFLDFCGIGAHKSPQGAQTYFLEPLSYWCKTKWENKHNAELLRADPGTKVRGNSVLGAVFSHAMLKMDFRYSHRFS